MAGIVEDMAAVAVRLAEGAGLREALPDVDDPAVWIALDVETRHGAWSAADDTWLPAWQRTDQGRTLTDALRRGAELTDARLALALCHRDGRVRKRALGRAAGRPELLPLLVLRCADWAEPVRETARRLLAELLDAEAAVRLLPLILRIGRRGRGDFVTDLAAGLLRNADPRVLTPLYTDTHQAVRRYAYRLAVEEGHLSPSELARAAARDTDLVVQSLCADATLAAVAEGGADDDVLETLLGARGAHARAAGVTALRRAGRSERAVAFLGDRAGVVRACARYVVRQAGGDPRAWYRERCGAPGDLAPGVVSGLAECGERADAGLLWALTSHPVAAVRTRAVAGLRALDVTDVERMRELLDDPAPGVVREAALALVPSARALDDQWLMARLGPERPRAERVAAFRLLQAHDGVVRRRAAVALIDDPDERLRHWARQAVRR
ncbi:hypothetical protein [Streptomyces sp. 351MFTsu5.1]|uniref:hypothetical protein n=1 Tax=Streptomyces sp. 351MFTsu5.1 TaxID=1172180 RepID=UPI0003648BBD|nr:hypothetical protein [Streptomyces sp. 351MFTsu5.1]